MSDGELDALRAQWKSDGTARSGARYLQSMVTAGRLSTQRLALLAHLGEPAARLVRGDPPEVPSPREDHLPAFARRFKALHAWVEEMAVYGGDVLSRLSLALARAAMEGLTTVTEQELAAVELVEDWLTTEPDPQHVAAWTKLRSHAPRQGDDPVLEVTIPREWRVLCPKGEEEALANEVALQLHERGRMDEGDEEPEEEILDAKPESDPEPPEYRLDPSYLAETAVEATIWLWWLTRLGIVAGPGTPLPHGPDRTTVWREGERMPYAARPPQAYEDQYWENSLQEKVGHLAVSAARAKDEAWVRKTAFSALVPWLLGEQDPLAASQGSNREARDRRRATLRKDMVARRERERPVPAPVLQPLPDRVDTSSELQRLRSHWLETNDIDAGKEYLTARLRDGSLDTERVALLAWLDDPASRAISPVATSDSVSTRVGDLRRWGNEGVLRAAAALGRLLLPVWDREWANGDTSLQALPSMFGLPGIDGDELEAGIEAVEALIEDPSARNRAECDRARQDADAISSAIVVVSGSVGPNGTRNAIWIAASAAASALRYATRYEPNGPDVTLGYPDRVAAEAVEYGVVSEQELTQALLRRLRPWILGLPL